MVLELAIGRSTGGHRSSPPSARYSSGSPPQALSSSPSPAWSSATTS
ncbi:hypothetical protein [Methanoculleus chikugoensis]|nr:hypothetical protein [Methanoculleus chikugoensis]